MAGDLKIHERAVLSVVDAEGLEFAAAPRRREQGAPIHHYGRLTILASPVGIAEAPTRGAEERMDVDQLSEIERLGLNALRLRESADYIEAKQNRPRDGEIWNLQKCISVAPPPVLEARAAGAISAGPTSSYLEGTVAVGIVIVQGPTDDLQFSDEELAKVVAEVQNGLSWYATVNPLAGISFSYDIQNVNIATPPDPNTTDKEGLWRDPAMAALGYSADWAGVVDYVEHLRSSFGTRWTYCGFFTKYPLDHFAYARLGGPRVVMDYNNDGWGPDNIDRVFAHETGHIFNCPDEYASSGCTCGGSWGRFDIVNGNCQNCALGGGVDCLMRGNAFSLCEYTRSHLGWAPVLTVHNFGYNAGNWRVDKHPRFLADTTGDGLADIVGFGNYGVWASRAQTDGRFETPRLMLYFYGYDAGWRVDRHPRFVVDTTGDGKADIVAFGDDAVLVSRAQEDGLFLIPELAVKDFGYNDGWRVDQHPRFMADITGNGRADIVGFGNDGVWTSKAPKSGVFSTPELVLKAFGYNAGDWRVDKHPRLLADITGNGKADIVAFGEDGVWTAVSKGDGTFKTPKLVLDNFGYNAGNWRVDRHPRFLADITGDGKADIVGFGNDGVWMALSKGDGTFEKPIFVIDNFGYNNGWRVDQHPRFLADVTGDGKADVIGFGNDGVWFARSLGSGAFDTPGLIIKDFGYNAGDWRVDKHPRFMADITGDGRADVVGFSANGVLIRCS